MIHDDMMMKHDRESKKAYICFDLCHILKTKITKLCPHTYTIYLGVYTKASLLLNHFTQAFFRHDLRVKSREMATDLLFAFYIQHTTPCCGVRVHISFTHHSYIDFSWISKNFILAGQAEKVLGSVSL